MLLSARRYRATSVAALVMAAATVAVACTEDGGAGGSTTMPAPAPTPTSAAAPDTTPTGGTPSTGGAVPPSTGVEQVPPGETVWVVESAPDAARYTAVEKDFAGAVVDRLPLDLTAPETRAWGAPTVGDMALVPGKPTAVPFVCDEASSGAILGFSARTGEEADLPDAVPAKGQTLTVVGTTVYVASIRCSNSEYHGWQVTRHETDDGDRERAVVVSIEGDTAPGAIEVLPEAGLLVAHVGTMANPHGWLELYDLNTGEPTRLPVSCGTEHGLPGPLAVAELPRSRVGVVNRCGDLDVLGKDLRLASTVTLGKRNAPERASIVAEGRRAAVAFEQRIFIVDTASLRVLGAIRPAVDVLYVAFDAAKLPVWRLHTG